jgi:hypothetical protein
MNSDNKRAIGSDAAKRTMGLIHSEEYEYRSLDSLGGHLKSGQWWSPENRPMRK